MGTMLRQVGANYPSAISLSKFGSVSPSSEISATKGVAVLRPRIESSSQKWYVAIKLPLNLWRMISFLGRKEYEPLGATNQFSWIQHGILTEKWACIAGEASPRTPSEWSQNLPKCPYEVCSDRQLQLGCWWCPRNCMQIRQIRSHWDIL